MRVSITVFLTITLAILALPVVDAVADGPLVVSERNGEIVLEVSPRPDDRNPLPVRRFYVAVPPAGSVVAQRIGGEFESRPISQDESTLYEPSPETGKTRIPPGLFPPEPVVVSAPFIFRKTRVVAVDCYLRQLDSEELTARDWTSYQVVVRYPVAAATKTRNDADPLLANLVINDSAFPVTAREFDGRPARIDISEPMGFSKSASWIKIKISEPGAYVITGAELSMLIGSLNQIDDPSSVRMFTGGAFEQERDFADPDASWRVGNWMKEIPIYWDGNTDPVFEASERIIFYGQGAEDWADQFDPSADNTVYQKHIRAKENYYYLTWDSSMPGPPLRMQEVSSGPTASPDRTTFRERLYLEKDRFKDYNYGGDFWLWQKISREPGAADFVLDGEVNIYDPVDGVPQEFRTVALAPYNARTEGLPYNAGHHAVYVVKDESNNEHLIGDFRWDAFSSDYRYEDGRPVFLSGSFLTEGRNQVWLRLPRDDNPKDWMYFAWMSFAYERRLNMQSGHRLGFSSPDTSGVVNFRLAGVPAAGEVYVFDVTDRYNVARLTNGELSDDGGGARRLRFSSSIAGDERYFWATADDGLLPLTLSSMQYLEANDLRNRATAPRMLIVTDPSPAFRSAAERIAAYRRTHLPYFGSGTVEVVTTSEVYDNFSGGLPDPMAIRNYIKFLYDNFTEEGDPVLSFVLLLGDATADYKNRVSSAPDRVPSFLCVPPRNLDYETYVTDEWYAHMDLADQVRGFGVGDLAVGRLPAASSSEAGVLIDKIIAYENTSPLGNWRTQVILVADDEGPPTKCEPWFTSESEFIANQHVPQYVDVQKVYLVDFPAISTMKPGSRKMLIEKWNEGAVAINYIGHGGSAVLADEHVFLDDDVAKLNNGSKLPIFMAFSCTVGDFASPLKKSLSEELLLRANGGAIATVTASALSGIYPNEYLCFAMFDDILPREPGVEVALGQAAMTAKLNSMLGRCPPPDSLLCTAAANQESNNWKYNLLSDPALIVAVPQYKIRLIPNEPDSMVAGVRKAIRGAVYDDGAVDTDFNGSVSVRVHEPSVRRVTERCNLTYTARGGTIYRGTADVVNGEFNIDFRVPRYASPGRLAFITAYADDGSLDAAASLDSLFSLVLPTMADSTLLQPIDGPPRVQFGFKSGLKVAKPGESIQAIVHDQDGINILNTTTEGRHALLIDDSPVPLDVTKFFRFDHGGTDTSGVLVYPLPELPVGGHRAIFKVADSFAQTTLDTLEFSVTDPLDYFAEVVLNYPNPFSTSTQFLVQLSNGASIRLDIFTVSGKRIRRLEEVSDGGEEWIFWDGRDSVGDEIANGTYLYVATVTFSDIDRSPLVMRGKITKIQ